MEKKIEVMTPAGSFESLSAAINAGADSVYFGIEQLNMRARSSNNFTLEDLKTIVSRCKSEGVKTYLTVNTVLYNHDLNLMQQIVKAAKEQGVDAIIASDPAVMGYAKSIAMPVHISTQANVSNIESVRFYALFADVMVLARELSLMQVKEIADEIVRNQIKGPSGDLIRLEVFAHGALCMAVSGKCYLSLHSNFASANRGACIQNCRKEYIVTEKEEGTELLIDNEYIMSAKDLCTIDFLDQVIDAGVTVLKLEGRGRAADYVDTVTRCYKEAANSIMEGSYTKEKVQRWKEELAKVYNRGFWDGYYLGKKMGEWSDSYGSIATTKKIFLGRAVKYYPKIKVGEFYIETHQLKDGDDLMVTGPDTGVCKMKAAGFRVADNLVSSAQKGDTMTIAVGKEIKRGDKLYKIVAS
jgi:U32 family peptidase